MSLYDNVDAPPSLAMAHGDFHVRTLDPDLNPNHVLETGRDFTVRLHWWLEGPNVPFMGGSFQPVIEMESKGKSTPDYEDEIGSPIAPVDWSEGTLSGNRIDFRKDILIPAASLPAGLVGVFDLSAFVTYTNVFGQVEPIAAFSHGPMIQIYKPA